MKRQAFWCFWLILDRLPLSIRASSLFRCGWRVVWARSIPGASILVPLALALRVAGEEPRMDNAFLCLAPCTGWCLNRWVFYGDETVTSLMNGF